MIETFLLVSCLFHNSCAKSAQPLQLSFSTSPVFSLSRAEISGVPARAKSLALVVVDEGASGKQRYPLVIYGIPAKAVRITGRSSFGEHVLGQYPPIPHLAGHHYLIELYALDEAPSRVTGTTISELRQNIKWHTVEAVGVSAV